MKSLMIVVPDQIEEYDIWTSITRLAVDARCNADDTRAISVSSANLLKKQIDNLVVLLAELERGMDFVSLSGFVGHHMSGKSTFTKSKEDKRALITYALDSGLITKYSASHNGRPVLSVMLNRESEAVKQALSKLVER